MWIAAGTALLVGGQGTAPTLQVGLEGAIKAGTDARDDVARVAVQAGTLNDAAYGVPDEPMQDDSSGASPCGFGPIDQDRLEVLLRAEAHKRGADLRFSTELTWFEQDGAGVTAALDDRAVGQQQTVQADYLIPGDGNHSRIRQRLGIGVNGPGQLLTTITAIVDADLNPALRGRKLSIAYLQQPQPFTILMAHDDQGRRWVFATGYDRRHASREDFTDDRVAELVRAAAGLPDVAVALRPQVPGTDLKVLAFPIAATIADRYRAGRVFLVGDAAHTWPPTGGLGANTGIQDAHNLAWKLAAVLKGTAGRRCSTPTTRSGGPPGCSPWDTRWPASARPWHPGRARRCSTTAPSRWATSTAARPCRAPPTPTRGRCRRWR